MKILFVTWDSPQATYLESLFLPIFSRLSESGFSFHILQFTWGDAARIRRSSEACKRRGFSYRAVPVWRWPRVFGALLTAFFGAWHVRKEVSMHAIDVVMPRSTLPALSVLLGLRASGKKVVFDADGLPLDERVEFAGQGASSIAYRLLRDVEAQAVRRSDRVIVRSSQAVDILLARAGAGTASSKFHIVGNGRDSNIFASLPKCQRDRIREDIDARSEGPLLVYAGSMGPKYRLQDMLYLFSAVHRRRDDARLLILTNDPAEVASGLSKHTNLRDLVQVKQVLPDEVAAHLACADLGIALFEQSFSMRAVAPVKLGEYLLCGIPVVTTTNIGDSGALPSDCGFLIDILEAKELNAAADWFVDTVLSDREGFRFRCREFGMARYSLNACTDSYVRALLGLNEAS